MIAILIADGFEEIEALTPLDVLRRAKLPVRTVGIGGLYKTGSHGIEIKCDLCDEQVNCEKVDAVILPGGMPGAENLAESEFVRSVIASVNERGGIIGAICAAPLVLGRMGLLDGKYAVCYPGFESELVGAVIPSGNISVATCQNIVTARGMGVALDFALTLTSLLCDEKKSAKIADDVIAHNAVKSANACHDFTANMKSKVSFATPTTNCTYDDYQAPDISVLTPAPAYEEEAEDKGEEILNVYKNFDIEVSIGKTVRGRQATSYEVIPGKKVTNKKIVNLFNDVAITLGCDGLRLILPDENNTACRYEVPNDKRTPVYLSEMLALDEFKAAGQLVVPVGMQIGEKPVLLDLAKTPHVLIAGATGMGKSVCMNSFITTLIARNRPDEVKLVLIDPKKCELSAYRNIPHLLFPIITEMCDVVSALKWLVEEMERRYELFENYSTTRIDSFNDAVRSGEINEKPLPKIVVFIDELNDIMLQVRKPCEDLIMSIAQKARAAGIHLIIGTQRPSVNVITGTIKANIPTRISFKVASYIDSRTIMETAGAEKLLSCGDMLITTPMYNTPKRVQSTFVSDTDVKKITEQIVKYTKTPCEVKEAPKKECEAISDDHIAELLCDEDFVKTVELAISKGRICTSVIQRTMKFGYSKAAKYIDDMDELGIISPSDGAKPRDVLISTNEWLTFLNQRRVKPKKEEKEETTKEEAIAILKSLGILVGDEAEDKQEEKENNLLADPKFIAAVEESIKAGKTSTAFLQRKVGIGFAAATNYINAMSDMGIIESGVGKVASRSVLITMDDWKTMLDENS